MALKPWYKVVTPREDLREGRPLDASEFAVHLDKVREGIAPADYSDPVRFFERTYLTKNLTALAVEVVRRLSGEKTETSAIFNMTTQFGGGKTHALTLLYHLAKGGDDARAWTGVDKLLQLAKVKNIPKAATAIFVGTEFDSISGRGGDDGTPLRKTPWGEIAFQLGGEECFKYVVEHEKQLTAPAGDVISKILPKNKPCLILIDELMNYISRYRKTGLSGQFYDFLQNLTESVRSRDNVVLVVSIPASELEMTAEDQSDYERFKKLLDRVGKPIIMSAESETAEIIRRRLFEWDTRLVGQDGKVLLPKDAEQVCNEFADMLYEYRQQIPQWFSIDHAREIFKATYPFHPMVLSVFERKWQVLPRFQQTRGVLRLLATWVSRAYQEGYKGAHKDTLIATGSAPLEDSLFRAAIFEQLGESRLEGAVTTDICGRKDSHALRLDNEAVDSIKKSRLHKKVATTIFFESNGGMAKAEATLPEIRLAVAEPDIDIGNIETVLETLGSTCYYLSIDRNRFRFSTSPNLNKLLADRRASIQQPAIEARVKETVKNTFISVKGIDLVFFPEKSNQIPDRPMLVLAVMSPEYNYQDSKTLSVIDKIIKESGTSARTFKSALIFAIADNDIAIKEEVRKILAWESIKGDEKQLKLDETQIQQLNSNLAMAKRDLKEAVWRAYKYIALLDKNNTVKLIDMGLIHSSAADSITSLIVNRLQQDGDLETGISPNFLVRNWPPAFKEWSTKSVRDAFYASPVFPRLLSPEVIKDTISRGVTGGQLAYVGKSRSGEYEPFVFKESLLATEVEISDDMFIITKQDAEEYLKTKEESKTEPVVINVVSDVGGSLISAKVSQDEPKTSYTVVLHPANSDEEKKDVTRVIWSGEVPANKWMNFYTKFLTKFVGNSEVKISLKVEVLNSNGISKQKIEEANLTLKELGLNNGMKEE